MGDTSRVRVERKYEREETGGKYVQDTHMSDPGSCNWVILRILLYSLEDEISSQQTKATVRGCVNNSSLENKTKMGGEGKEMAVFLLLGKGRKRKGFTLPIRETATHTREVGGTTVL